MRKVVDDDAKVPRFIQTIPGSGYRLIARVSYDEVKQKEINLPFLANTIQSFQVDNLPHLSQKPDNLLTSA